MSIAGFFAIEICTNWIMFSDLNNYFYPYIYNDLVNAIIGVLFSFSLFYFNQRSLIPIKIVGVINKDVLKLFMFISVLLIFVFIWKWLTLDNFYFIIERDLERSLTLKIFLLYLPIYIGIPLYQEIIFRGFMVNAFIKQEKMVIYIVTSVFFTLFYLKDAILSPYTIKFYLLVDIPIVFCFSMISIYARLKSGGLLISIVLAILFSFIRN